MAKANWPASAAAAEPRLRDRRRRASSARSRSCVQRASAFARSSDRAATSPVRRFSVADLTLAALVAPAIAPEQFPYPQPQRHDPRLERVRAALDENGIREWAHRMYARHRGSSAEVAAG